MNTTLKPPTQRLFERAAPSGRIDTEAGVIHDVRIVGMASTNGRRYPAKVLQDAKHLYQNAKVFIDHPGRDKQHETRSMRDSVGWLQRIRFDGKGLIGDLHFLKSHPESDQLVERATRSPGTFGLSHVVEGEVELSEDGTTVVTKIHRVASVDLVTEPATNMSLFESRDRGGDSSLHEYELRWRRMILEADANTIRSGKSPDDWTHEAKWYHTMAMSAEKRPKKTYGTYERRWNDLAAGHTLDD